MPCYFIARIKINDTCEYQKYIERSSEIFSRYKGEYLVVENDPVVLEGSWDCTRTILIKFDNTDDFNEWYHSGAYQEILKHRLNAADCNAILAQGLNF